MTQVNIGIDEHLTPPSVSLCFRYIDLFEFFLKEKFPNKHEEDTRVRYLLFTTTVKQIFTFAPQVDEVIENCAFKKPASYALNEADASDCQTKYFNTTVYYVLEYVCYRIDYRASEDQFDYFKQANSPTNPGMLYEVTFGKRFDTYKYVKVVAHSSTSFPLKGLSMVPFFDRNEYGGFKAEGKGSRKYYVNYFVLTQKRLPPPYLTMCTNYTAETKNVKTQAECHQTCAKEMSRKTGLNKTPFGSIETEWVEMGHMSYNDILNESVVAVLPKLKEECDQACRSPDCDEVTYFTRTFDESNDKLAVKVSIPSEPSFQIEYKPILSFIEFMVYILSCFGTWFGLAVLSFEPVQLYNRYKEWRTHKRGSPPVVRLNTGVSDPETKDERCNDKPSFESRHRISRTKQDEPKGFSGAFNESIRSASGINIGSQNPEVEDALGQLKMIRDRIQQMKIVNAMFNQRLNQVFYGQRIGQTPSEINAGSNFFSQVPLGGTKTPATAGNTPAGLNAPNPINSAFTFR